MSFSNNIPLGPKVPEGPALPFTPWPVDPRGLWEPTNLENMTNKIYQQIILLEYAFYVDELGRYVMKHQLPLIFSISATNHAWTKLEACVIAYLILTSF